MATVNLELMLDYRKRFVEVLSRHYPSPTPWLTRHAGVWDWDALSQNTALAWDEALLDAHADRWNWRGVGLSTNTALPWSADLIRKYVGLGKWEWRDLGEQPKVFESAEMVELCLPHWSAAAETTPGSGLLDAGAYGRFELTPWGVDAARWASSVLASSPGFRWDLFSAVKGFPWSADFIEAHTDKLDWRRLSFNSVLPWTIDFIRRFEDRWDWAWTSPDLPWSLELLEAFEHRFDWDYLSVIDEIPWTEAWLDRFATKLSWASYSRDGTVDGLVNHPGFRWTPATFARHRSDVEAQFRQLAEVHEELALQYWTYHCDTNNWTAEFVELLLELERTGEINQPTIPWERLCERASGIWTPEFIDAHRDRIDWEALSNNEELAPNASILSQYADRWNWRSLSRNARMNVETLVAVADRLDVACLVSNKHLDRQAVVALRELWTPVAWRYLSRREFVSFDDAETELPWCWDTLIERAGAELSAQINGATVLQFLHVVERDRQPPPRNLELEAAIARDLEQRDNYEVYADWLLERGDPHASLIRATLDTSEPFDIAEFGTTRQYQGDDDSVHVSAYERFVEFDPRGTVWRRGFVRAMWGQRERWERLVGLRAFRFLEALHLDYQDPLVDDDALELLRPLDCLAKLSVQKNRLEKPTALAHLHALTHLCLDRSKLTDLSPLSGLPRLRSLSIQYSEVRDLGPLGEIPNLRRVNVGSAPLDDLSPLRACRNLVELDVSRTAVWDLSPLRELRSLLRIFVDNTAVTEAEIRALREALPALAVCNPEEYWRSVGNVGRFWSPSDC